MNNSYQIIVHETQISQICPYDYFANAKRVCSEMSQPAIVVNHAGKRLYGNAAAKKVNVAYYFCQYCGCSSGKEGPRHQLQYGVKCPIQIEQETP